MQLGLPFQRARPQAPPPRVVPSPPPRPSGVDRSAGDAPSAAYFVRHQRARRYLLRLDPDGRARVTIPRGGSRREAEAFLERNRDWVTRQRAHQTSVLYKAADKSALQAQAASVLPPRLLALAGQHGLTVTKISIRDQRTRWGSCARDGHICLNWRLVLMPEWVRDYVLIHELMHLRRLDHSPAYWRHVAAACPAYRDARTWLRANGARLR
jgi:predicted metal-dependent hydrolase